MLTITKQQQQQQHQQKIVPEQKTGLSSGKYTGARVFSSSNPPLIHDKYNSTGIVRDAISKLHNLEPFVEYIALIAAYLSIIIVAEWFYRRKMSAAQFEDFIFHLPGYDNFNEVFDARNAIFGRWKLAQLYGGMPKEKNIVQLENTLILCVTRVFDDYRKGGLLAWGDFRFDFRFLFGFVNAAAPFSIMIFQLCSAE